jgi:hypothetical protein
MDDLRYMHIRIAIVDTCHCGVSHLSNPDNAGHVARYRINLVGHAGSYNK